MAVFYPDQPSDFNNSLGERAVFEALRTLDKRFSVFYSLGWLNPRRSGDRFGSRFQGEADFVLIDPDRGLLVIEVKSGGIRCARRQWYQTNLFTHEEFSIFDPIQQANASAHFLRELLKERILGSTTRVFHAVWFPSITFDCSQLPVDVAQPMILDSRALSAPQHAIDTVYEFWNEQFAWRSIDEKTERSILQILAPEFSAMPSFRASMDARERQFVRLTKEQARIFEFLDDQDAAVVSGPAGSGKTVMALECARRIGDAGSDVVFLCFNSALRRFLANTHRNPRIQFHTFHSFATSCVGKKDLGFEELEEKFLSWLANDDEVSTIPNLIIDEAQDFNSEWIEWLLYRTRGKVFAFYDPNQLIYQRELPIWIRNAKCRLNLSRVCRNTQQIARTVARAIGSSKCTAEFAPAGLKPQLHIASGVDETKRIVTELINRHITSNSVNPRDIAILTFETTASSNLAHADWPFPVSEEYAQSQVCFTSIRKFKGLEAKIIILLDLDLGRLTDNEYRRLFYIACSRAVHELHVVLMGPTNRAVQTAVTTFSGGDKTGNLKSLGFLLAAELNRDKAN